MTEITKGLFIDVSSSDLLQIKRAFDVGTLTRNNHKIPVTVALCMGAVRFVNKSLPLAAEHIKIHDKTLHDHMTMFLNAGGSIIVCPMRLKGEGLTSDDLLEGVKVADRDTTLTVMLEKGVKTLSY